MYLDYSAKLDKTLTYRRPAVAVAPEDVLGLGFWPTWMLLLVLTVAVNTVAYALGARRTELTLAVVVAFVALSIVDYHLYGVLATQVLAGK